MAWELFVVAKETSKQARFEIIRATVGVALFVTGALFSLTGAMVGGILLGLIEAIGAGYLGELTGGVLGSHYADIFAFIALILVLTLRPSGLLGERVADRA